MNQFEGEDCSICFRSFGNTAVPVTLQCGHSFCNDCCANLRNCPLCRKRIRSTFKRITNYSLLSLVNRLENQNDRKETRDQETQTDPPPRPTRHRTPMINNIPGIVAIQVIAKLTRVQTMLAKISSLNSNGFTN